jgi:ribonuclease E
VIVADEQLHTPHYEVTRIRENELGEETAKPSYQRGTAAQARHHRADQGQPQHPAGRR